MYEPVQRWELVRYHGPRRGVVNYMDQILAVWGSRGAKSAGIYNRRKVRGGSSWSTHAVGRGGDIAAPALVLREIREHLVAGYKSGGLPELGEVIYNRMRWTPATGWRRYRGDPHTGHLHFSLDIKGADTKLAPKLDRERICRAMFPR